MELLNHFSEAVFQNLSLRLKTSNGYSRHRHESYQVNAKQADK